MASAGAAPGAPHLGVALGSAVNVTTLAGLVRTACDAGAVYQLDGGPAILLLLVEHLLEHTNIHIALYLGSVLRCGNFGDAHTCAIGASDARLDQAATGPMPLGLEAQQQDDLINVVPTQRTSIRVPTPFEFKLCLMGHGWIALSPHQFDKAAERWQTVMRVGSKVVDALVYARDAESLRVEITASTKLTTAEVASVRQQLRHMMRLDDDLSAFYTSCRSEPQRHWVAKRGGGRLLRSATTFEDLMKLLFTTNTTWSSTELMTRNLVQAIGSKAPSGNRAFPSAKQCLRDEEFYRDVVRCGYRAGAAMQLAQSFVDRELTDETFLATQPSNELWERLCGLRGFGPYAAGQAMRLCGHYDRLAIDSWCRATIAKMAGRKKPPTDKAIERRYAKLAPFQGLAMWCDLTASWHE